MATGSKLPRFLADLIVELVPADQMEPNPRNPCSQLTPEERYARFIQILTETYNEMKRKEGGGQAVH
jgi:hypothetical protein